MTINIFHLWKEAVETNNLDISGMQNLNHAVIVHLWANLHSFRFWLSSIMPEIQKRHSKTTTLYCKYIVSKVQFQTLKFSRGQLQNIANIKSLFVLAMRSLENLNNRCSIVPLMWRVGYSTHLALLGPAAINRTGL